MILICESDTSLVYTLSNHTRERSIVVAYPWINALQPRSIRLLKKFVGGEVLVVSIGVFQVNIVQAEIFAHLADGRFLRFLCSSIGRLLRLGLWRRLLRTTSSTTLSSLLVANNFRLGDRFRFELLIRDVAVVALLLLLLAATLRVFGLSLLSPLLPAGTAIVRVVVLLGFFAGSLLLLILKELQ